MNAHQATKGSWHDGKPRGYASPSVDMDARAQLAAELLKAWIQSGRPRGERLVGAVFELTEQFLEEAAKRDWIHERPLGKVELPPPPAVAAGS